MSVKQECPGLAGGETRAKPQPQGALSPIEYSHAGYKNLSILEPWEDAVGFLHSVEMEDGRTLAHIGPLCVALPGELSEDLRRLIGRRVAILRTDADYRFREAS